MSGAIEAGEVVGAKKVRRFTRYNIGDVIVFKVGGVQVIHEIVGTKTVNGEIQYETKGVNNELMDPWTVSRNDIVGKVDMSKNDLDKLLLRVEQGKTTLEKALGQKVTPALTSSYIIGEIQSVLQKYYESTISDFYGDVENYIKTLDLPPGFRPAFYDPTFQHIINTEKIMTPVLLDIFIYVLNDLIGIEDRETYQKTFSDLIKSIKAYARHHKIPIKDKE